MRLLVPLLLPALALGAPPPTTQRTGVFIIPMDQAAEAGTVRLESYMLEALESEASTVLKRPEELFGAPVDPDAELSLEKAQKSLAEGRRAFEASRYEDAEHRLRAALRGYERAAPAMTRCGGYCEGHALLAAVLVQRGDAEAAQPYLVDYTSMASEIPLDAKKLGEKVVKLHKKVVEGYRAKVRGSLTVKSRPSGAKVFVDGEFAGYAPLELEAVSAGKHHVRIERPGFRRHGQLVEVSPNDLLVQADLVPTSTYRGYDSQLDRLASEVTRGGGATIASLGKRLGLDRGLVGTLKEVNERGATELSVGLFDLHTGKQLSSRKVVLQGDEYGQLRLEVTRVVSGLMSSVGAPPGKTTAKGDPLNQKQGTEDWGADDRLGRKHKRGGGDPLDGRSGTEDW
jgi:hypothetical protein